VSKVIRGCKDPNLDSIIAPPVSFDPSLWKEDIRAVMKNRGWIRGIPVWNALHLSTKTGPNTQAIMGAMTEAHLLSDEMLNNIKIVAGEGFVSAIQLSRKFNFHLFNSHFKIIKDKILILLKLSFI
jgi:hypothetical protein